MTMRRWLGILSLHLAAIGLAAWVGTGSPLWVVLAAPAAVVGLLLEGPRGRLHALAGISLLLGVLAVLGAERHLEQLARGWPERSAAWEREIQLRLEADLDALLRQGEAAAAALASGAGAMDMERTSVPQGVRPGEIDAVALFGTSGELISWDGLHQGPIPDEVRQGASRFLYSEGALFGYLYVTEPLPQGAGTAMAASLLRSELPELLEPPGDDFEARFESRTGAEIGIARAERAIGESIWDLRWEDETLFSVTLLPASEADARSQLHLRWARAIALLVALGWIFIVIGARGRPGGGVTAIASLLAILLLLPLGRLTGADPVLTPADFLLPGPFALTFGHVLALAVGGVLGAGLLAGKRVPGWTWVLGVPVAILLSIGALLLLEMGASRDFLAGGESSWVLFQGAAVALVTLALHSAFLGEPRDGEATPRWTFLSAAILSCVALAIGWTWLVQSVLHVPRWMAVFWVVPLGALVHGLPTGSGWAVQLSRWTGLVTLAVTLAIPWAWSARVEARIAAAEERVDRLGTRPDPFLEFLLLRAAETADRLAEEERDPVEVLYGAWTQSGLAWEGVPLWITYWSPGGVPQEELRIGVSEVRPDLPPGLLQEAREGEEVVVRRFDLADAHYLGVTPLQRGAAVSIVIPPRRALEGASPLGPLFSPARSRQDPLVLIPLLPGEAPGATEGIEWLRTADGWQGETFLAYPDEAYHAHYVVELPGWALRLARGTLLLFLNLSVLALIWAAGRWMGEVRRSHVGARLGALNSFRGRVTLALFAFFLIPSVAFGTLAYRTLAGAASRTAEALAQRAAEDAAAWYAEVDGAIDVLAQRVGSDLLLYENGELTTGSLPELVRLGLYEGWLPQQIHGDLVRGEEMMTLAQASLGGLDYVVAYRRIAGGRVLAAPAPLEAGATALRQRDVTDLIGLSVLLGGLLSVLLSLRVGRELASPIQTLQIASERVGAGNMKVHLPERRDDEFGAVFSAFNRMVDRLSQTRRALLRTSRRTRAIMEEVATGVIALNRQARITLANPRAEELLGVSLQVGASLPGSEAGVRSAGALGEWVAGYFRDGLREAGTEIALGDRRIRVRARRISRRGPLGGAVLSLEDVTDELRTERILAWGEMAQQVAHEVKNPLTPIKLGIQHIRRAWEGGDAEFPAILDRNVNAILGEIDRLASVATSFSRFAAPSPVGTEPLEAIDVSAVTDEVLDLYAAGGGPVAFEFTPGDELPRVQSRAGELKEVLVNLLENARAALPEGGRVTVEAEWRGAMVELRVRDNGTGIPPDLLPRIFEPHFSTRSTGSGLGLAIVRRLVESWGGRVLAESPPGQGTVIVLRLPPWDPPSEISDVASGTGGGAAPPES